MKKFSKMLALGMALSLAFGMMVCAADSVTVETSGLGNDVTIEAAGLSEGETLLVTPMAPAEKSAAKAELAKDTVKNAIGAALGYEKVSVSLAATFDADVYSGESLVEGRKVTITFNWGSFDATKKYAVLHFNGEAWEVVKATVTANGVKATFGSLSPIAVVEVVPAGDNSDDSSDDETKSPATGEALPMAGIMALICLAGAGICAGKVRYNKQ